MTFFVRTLIFIRLEYMFLKYNLLFSFFNPAIAMTLSIHVMINSHPYHPPFMSYLRSPQKLSCVQQKLL